MRKILEAIPSTEPATFGEFCRAYDDCPEKGDREGWAEVFDKLNTLENLDLIEVERANDRIQTLILTDAGVQRLKELRNKSH